MRALLLKSWSQVQGIVSVDCMFDFPAPLATSSPTNLDATQHLPPEHGHAAAAQ